MRKPDFFIVGAPKCGTTAMNDYLREHPEIFIPAKKEIHFFGTDLPFVKGKPVTEQEYLAYFSPARGEKRAGESSVWYLYSQQAATEIRAFNPATHIIIMLRNPIDMMYSLHSQRVYNDNENIADFAEALAAEADRRQGKRLYHKASDAMGSLYRAAATYTPQVQRYFTTFGRERVLVIIFDDFVRTTSEVYRQTCEFLEVDSQFRPEFRIVNANKGIYSPALRSFLRYPPKPVRWLLPLLGLRPARRQGFKGWLRRLNAKHESRPSMDPELRRRLQVEFTLEVEQLSTLLGRDLTHWCQTDKIGQPSPP
jgi:hypothetical protein